MREEQLKQAIESLTQIKSEQDIIYKALLWVSILRHADPEIMRQAGWVREEEYRKAVDGLKTVMKESDFPKSFAMAALIDLKEITPKQ